MERKLEEGADGRKGNEEGIVERWREGIMEGGRGEGR